MKFKPGDLVILLNEKQTLAIYIAPYSKHGHYHKLLYEGIFWPVAIDFFKHA